MTHTPGPWKVQEWDTETGAYIRVSTPDNGFGTQPSIVILPSESRNIVACNGVSVDEYRANARLIAAAPELLDMLKGLLDTAKAVNDGNKNQHADYHGFAPSLFDKCNQIIAKAEGRE